MGKNNKRQGEGGMVFSTSGNYGSSAPQEEDTLAPAQQLLYVSIDRKQRRGKEVTLIEGFVGKEDDLVTLAKALKSKCGVGGNAKEGDILIQGNKRDQVIALLEKDGYKVKRKGG